MQIKLIIITLNVGCDMTKDKTGGQEGFTDQVANLGQFVGNVLHTARTGNLPVLLVTWSSLKSLTTVLWGIYNAHAPLNPCISYVPMLLMPSKYIDGIITS